ncbi:trypco2 family protein [Dactylosporangium salmoneum]|uniref:Trypsin-co-occurring domain-containing protein n=1 Tax=Dactylosporangium salmoneum TaxID=53361 RepID=A0ABP5V9L3_9ACTN
MDDAIQLADVIWQLRHELSRAMWAGENADLKFEADAVNLELTVAVERSADPGIKVKFWVLDANAGTKRATTVTQKIQLSLRPVRADAPGRPATISGEALPGEE